MEVWIGYAIGRGLRWLLLRLCGFISELQWIGWHRFAHSLLLVLFGERDSAAAWESGRVGRGVVGLINLHDHVLQIAAEIGKEGAEWQILKQFVHQRVIKLEHSQYYDARSISHHRLPMVEELAGDGEEREVVCARIDEEFDRCRVDTECKGFKERYEGVH